MNETIPSYQLKQEDQPISFSIRTMEEIDLRHGGQGDVPHRHDYYTVLWSFTATGTHFIDFKEYPLEPGHIFFISPGQVHQVITDPSPTGIVILFTRDFLQYNGIRETFITHLKLFRDCNDNAPLPLSEAQATKLRVFVESMLAAYGSDQEFKYDTLGAYLRLFLIECNNTCSLDPPHTQQLQAGQQLLHEFKEMVEREYKGWHKVGEYAEALSITPSYLNNVVKSFLGKTAKEYILERLLLEAKRLVIFSSLSAKQIGYELGFDDPSNFSKFFRKMSGQNIAAFRQHESLPA